MPELPEVETIRRDIDKEFVSKKIKQVDVSRGGSRTIRRHKGPKDFITRVEGRKLVGTRRRGKYLLLNLDNGDVLVMHMGMSGQVLRSTPKDPPVKHTHVVLHFVGAPQLRFVDPRTFGEVFVTTPEQLEKEVPELAHLGFDPLDEQISWVDFAARLRGLIDDRSRAEHMGTKAHERVRADFLGDAHLIRWVNLFTDLLG